MSDEPRIDQSVTSHNQSGGITARTVINLAPVPGIAGEIVRENDREGDEYVTEARLRLEAGYAAGGIRIEATGEAPVQLEVAGGATPQDASMMMFRESDLGEGAKAIEVSPLIHQAYRAIVHTKRPQAIRFVARLL
jgi:hypothetical protein